VGSILRMGGKDSCTRGIYGKGREHQTADEWKLRRAWEGLTAQVNDEASPGARFGAKTGIGLA